MFSTETLVKNIVNKVRGVHLVATDSEPVDTMTDMDAVVAPSRRQRQREATVEEVLTVASALVARDGAATLSLREIAREMGLTPSALYRYYASRDAILTALTMRGFADLGAAVEAAAATAPPQQFCPAMLAACHAFRTWALEHPHEYGLMFGTPVPGFTIDTEQVTDAVMRTGMVLIAQLVGGVQAGLVTVPDEITIPADLRPGLQKFVEHKSNGILTIAEAAVAMQFWVLLLGLVSSEVYCHLPEQLILSGPVFFDHTVRRALVAIGVDADTVAGARLPA